ncbi:MAG: 26S protease regulatory subunit [Clostridiales bacterium]|nr:26S protease regulatory subunit [Clostridiales bacterium]
MKILKDAAGIILFIVLSILFFLYIMPFIGETIMIVINIINAGFNKLSEHPILVIGIIIIAASVYIAVFIESKAVMETSAGSVVSKTEPIQIKDQKAFERLIGLKKAKEEVRNFFEIINTYMAEPEVAKQYELKPPKGLLLYGPPGNGKTSFARACASYYGFAFISIKGSELIAGDGAVGIPQQRIKDLFAAARTRKPCIIFFDEIDSIAQVRSGRSINSPSDILLDALLNEIDGFDPLRGVFIIAATNRMDILDPALIRPGRLEKHIEIGNPNFGERIAIIKAHIGQKPVKDDIDYHLLSELTKGKSGAFLEACVNQANISAFKERRKINQADLSKSIEDFA